MFPVDFFGVRKFKQLFHDQLDYISDKILQRKKELTGLERNELSADLPYLDELLFEARKEDQIHGIDKHHFLGLMQPYFEFSRFIFRQQPHPAPGSAIAARNRTRNCTMKQHLN